MKKRVAVIAGGDSGEHEISLNSAKVVVENLAGSEFEPYLIIIKGQDWTYFDDKGMNLPIKKEDFTLVRDGEKIMFDCVFNIIHGTPGENGKIQGYFDILGFPYTSCGVTASALTFNKYLCNHVVRSLGIPVSKSVLIRSNEELNVNEVEKTVGFPCFVKPNNGGSSVGTSRVNTREELPAAVNAALREDDHALVEKYIPGREITCGVINITGHPQALPITEVISKKEFFDFEAKYTKGLSEEVTPADIPEKLRIKCQETSLFLFRELDCKGVVRFDYIFNDEGLFFLEVNTIPGLSAASIVPQQARVAGMTLRQLFTGMIRAALKTV